MSVKRRRKFATTISAAHEEKKLTCQEIDLSVDIGTKDKNSSNDPIYSSPCPIEDSDAIKIVNCTYCKGKIGALKNFNDVVSHTMSCNAPFIQVQKFRKYIHNIWVTNSGYTHNKIITFSFDNPWMNDDPFFRCTYQKDFSSKRKVTPSSTFFECLRCPDLNQFRYHEEYEHLINHQKDEHGIEYSSEFLSKPETESSENDTEGKNSERKGECLSNDQGSKSDSENKNYFAECVEKTSQIQSLEVAKTKMETELASTKKALGESRIECVEKTSKIQALEIEKFKFKAEVSSAQNDLEEIKVECFEKTSKIQALEIAKVKSETLSERDALNLTIKSMEEQALPCPSVVQEQQAEDYNKLLKAYNQYIESYNKINEDCIKLTAEKEELANTIKFLESKENPEEENKTGQEQDTAEHSELLEAYNKLNEECTTLTAEKEALIQTIKSMEELVQAEPQKDNVQEQKAEEYVKLLEDCNQNVETYKELNEECSKVIAERDSLIQTIQTQKDIIQAQKAEEYEKLLEGYNQYVESYNNLNEEYSKVIAERDALMQTIKSMEEQVKPECDKDNLDEQKREDYEKLVEG